MNPVKFLSRVAAFAFAALALTLTGAAQAAEHVTLLLNWTPTADHSPFYYAKQQGLYEKAGIDLTIEVGKGSGVSSQRVGSGGSAFGIADLPTALVARSKGADVVAVMSIYANTAQTFYWLKSYGVNGPKDFPGHKIGNPPGDASRVMWPAFAKAAHIDPNAVSFVNISPQAKLPSLKSHAVDIISDFYNEHDLKVLAFGDDLGFVRWPDIGLNPYGNSLVVNGAYLEKNPKLVEDFVKISQKAFAACVANVDPCLDALLQATSGLEKPTQLNQWERIKSMMADKFTTTKALGWIDPGRMQSDYDLVQTYLGMDKPFDVNTAFTTRFLDESVKMDAAKVKY
ncbi:MAG: ABC transporter substrate-binding protein [Methylobacteriaceae bacterium]|nr:ABC transporter substrate-binding protein [Methylobacteriaceae bacterium]